MLTPTKDFELSGTEKGGREGLQASLFTCARLNHVGRAGEAHIAHLMIGIARPGWSWDPLKRILRHERLQLLVSQESLARRRVTDVRELHTVLSSYEKQAQRGDR